MPLPSQARRHRRRACLLREKYPVGVSLPPHPPPTRVNQESPHGCNQECTKSDLERVLKLMIEKGYVDEYYEKLGDWGGVTGYLRTGPNADALTRGAPLHMLVAKARLTLTLTITITRWQRSRTTQRCSSRPRSSS